MMTSELSISWTSGRNAGGIVVGGETTHVATPLIAVEGEEINIVRCVTTTGEIVLQHRSQFCNISSAITDGDFAVVLGGSVGLEISSGSLDVGSSLALVGGGDHLVAHEEAQSIVVLGKLIHDAAEPFVLLARC